MAILGAILQLLLLAILVIGKNTANHCTIYHNGCSYHVALKSSNCMIQDDPGNSVQTVKNPVEKDSKTNSEDVVGEDEEMVPVKQIAVLEKKLVKMMEGLSIRSLRHIRRIRDDLHQMSVTMDLIKQQGTSKKHKRGLGCPPEFVSVGTWSSCYRFSSFNATWHEAREYCNAFGADLVALDTLKEAYILDYLLKSNPEYDMPKGYWTSGNYIARNRKWMWTTKHHLRPMTFSRWGPGEPDARSTMHCMLLYKFANYRWHDAVCSDRHHFICEIEI